MIDATGVPRAATALETAQYIDGDLPQSFAATFFSRYEHMIFILSMIVALLGGLLLRSTETQNHSGTAILQSTGLIH